MDDKLITAIIATVTSVAITAIGYFTAIKRIKREKVESFKVEHYKNQMEAYLVFWTVLRPFTEYEGFNDRILKVKDNQSYIDRNSMSKFHLAFNEFFYSKNGIFLSRKLRNEIFHTRDYLEKISNEKKGDLIKISNSTAKKIKYRFIQVRNVARSDIGVRDMNLPTKELELIDQ